MYKRRYLPVKRDFPEGCGVFLGHNKSNSGEPKFKEGIVQVQSDVKDVKVLSDHSETKSFGVAMKEASILESVGTVKDHQEKEVKQDEMSLVKKRRLRLHNSTMDVGTDVVNTSKRSIVLGLAAQSKWPFKQPKNRASR